MNEATCQQTGQHLFLSSSPAETAEKRVSRHEFFFTILVLICLRYLNITKFYQLIFSKIVKIRPIARCQQF